MQAYVPRFMESVLLKDLETHPVVALLGPRQCGKTTLVQRLGSQLEGSLYRDLERPRDVRQFDDPELFLETNKDQLLILDEVQHLPNLFPVLRGFVDRHDRAVRLLLLGSSSPSLLKRSSESLAGRLMYRELTPLLWPEIHPAADKTDLSLLKTHWLRGGYPLSVLANNDSVSYEWRASFLHSMLTRDIPAIGIRVAPLTLERFMRMLSLQHGQLLNQTVLGNSLGVTGPTIRHYLEILQGTFHVRTLEPWLANPAKRLVKTPRVYVRDSGLLHALWEAPTFNDILGHPLFGASWEGYVIEQLRCRFPHLRASHYRTASGVEVDLVLEHGRKCMAIETKASTDPQLTRGFWTAVDDLQPDQTLVVAPVEVGWPVRNGVQLCSIQEALQRVEDHFG